MRPEQETHKRDQQKRPISEIYTRDQHTTPTEETHGNLLRNWPPCSKCLHISTCQ